MGAIGAIGGLAGSVMGIAAEAGARAKQAEAHAKASNYEAWNEYIEAQMARIKAEQTNTAMTQQLMNVTANIRAVRGSTGTAPESPTGTAVLARTEALGGQDIRRRVESLQQEAEMHMMAHYYYMQVVRDI